MSERAPHAGQTWWADIVLVAVIVTMGVTLWRPSPGPTTTSAEGEQKIDALAALLASSPTDSRAIDQRIQSFASFPPDSSASRALADGLSACETATLDDAHRRRLARELYAITMPTDALPQLLPGALTAIRESLTGARCSATAIDAVLTAARRVARLDPNRRRDWW